MTPQSTVRIPLRARDGADRRYALIDAVDAEWASQWRWGFNGHYAVRHETRNGRSTSVYLHRELLGLTHGDGLEGDHINRDGLDNRRCNLRIVNRSGNQQNAPGNANCTSRYRGVHWDKVNQKWRAEVGINGKHIKIGRFSSEADAAEAARQARLRLLPYAVD